MKIVIYYVGGLIALLALGWLLKFNGLMSFQFFAPKYEAARRETFEQSKAYRDGMAQELRSLQLEYVKATPETKPAIASIIRHKAAGTQQDSLPLDLQVFIKELP